MREIKFKTNINCGSCVRAVTSTMNDLQGIAHWSVDTNHPEKILTIQGDITIQSVIEAIQDIGFDIETQQEHPLN